MLNGSIKKDPLSQSEASEPSVKDFFNDLLDETKGLSIKLLSKTAIFEGWPWLKFNNLGLAQGTTLKFYTTVTKGLKLKVIKFCELIHTFVEVSGEKMEGGIFTPAPPPILNKVNKVKKTKTENIFVNVVCSVLTVKEFLVEHKEIGL